MQDNENNVVKNEGDDFNVAKLLGYFFAYWKLFAASFVVCVLLAVLYIINAVPVYQISAKILLQDKEKGSFTSQLDMLADFGMQASNTNVENEIEVINSMSVVRGAVFNSGLYVTYALPGFVERPIYRGFSPVEVSYNRDSIANLLAPISLEFDFNKGKSTVKYRYEYELGNLDIESQPVAIDKYPYVLNTVAGDVFIAKNPVMDADTIEGNLNVTINPLGATAKGYMRSMGIAPVSKTSSVVVLAVNTPVPEDGVEFLNAIMWSYNKVTNDDKLQVALKTELFINERLDSLNLELIEKETALATYKKNNHLVDPKLDAPQTIQNKSMYVKMLEELDLKIEASKFLNAFMNDSKNDMKVIPTTFGMEVDPALTTLINSYNNEVVLRNRLLLSVTNDNPALKSATERVRILQTDLRSAFATQDKSLSVQRRAVALLVDNYTSRLEESPGLELELMTLSRESEVKSQLYVMLLQKYEENALNLAVAADNLRCIDAPEFNTIVAPNKKMILALALFMSLLLPSAFIYVRETLRTQVRSVDEVQKLISVPHVGTIPVKKDIATLENPVVVEKNNNDVMAEAFRALRTNLQFVMKKSSGKVVMFTSTTSGEGKTFIASNLAVSTALLGKRVILVGLDIRRPRLAEMFKFDASAEGLTSYLVADESRVDMLDKLIIKSGIADGFDILPAGIVPPNPAELLSRGNLDRAVEYLSTKYDYIIMDTAPVGLVTDSMIVSRVADAVVYVVRIDYTNRYDISFLNTLLADGKLENVSVVVNGEDIKKKMYGYASGSKGYGHYGYVQQ